MFNLNSGITIACVSLFKKTETLAVVNLVKHSEILPVRSSHLSFWFIEVYLVLNIVFSTKWFG